MMLVDDLVGTFIYLPWISSGTDVLRQLEILPHRDTLCSIFLGLA